MTEDAYFLFQVPYYPAYILLQVNIAFPANLGINVSQDREYSLLRI